MKTRGHVAVVTLQCITSGSSFKPVRPHNSAPDNTTVTGTASHGLYVINLHRDPAPLIHPLTAAALPLRVSSAARPRLCPCTSPSPSSAPTWWTAHLENRK